MKKEINLLGIKSKIVICHFDKSPYIAVMKEITDKEEKDIDNLLGYNSGKEKVNNERIFTYGEVNLNKNEDIDFINKLYLLSPGIMDNAIYSNFDYEKGIAISDDNDVFKRYPEVNPLKWFKFCYCLIGKPKRIIIYKTKLSYL